MHGLLRSTPKKVRELRTCSTAYVPVGVSEVVGHLLPVRQVVQRTPPAAEVLHVGRAAQVDVRPRRRGNRWGGRGGETGETALLIKGESFMEPTDVCRLLTFMSLHFIKPDAEQLGCRRTKVTFPH